MFANHTRAQSFPCTASKHRVFTQVPALLGIDIAPSKHDHAGVVMLFVLVLD
jgi:hypothetical protein